MTPPPIRVQLPEIVRPLLSPKRYKILYGGRGGIKTTSFTILALLFGMTRSLYFLCARETMDSIKQSVHKELSDWIRRLELLRYYAVEKNAIYSRINDTLFTFAGLSHNVDNIKSTASVDVLWVEEAASVTRDSWDTVIPTIRKDDSFGPGTESEIWVAFNPKLPTDDTYKRFILNTPPNAIVIKTGYEDNPFLPKVLRAEIEWMKEKDPARFAHIYGGECANSVEGAIYEEEFAKVDLENRFCTVPYFQAYPVHTVWDLGWNDTNAIWFVQCYGGYFNFIDYYENNKKNISHYIVEMQKKGYVYGTDWLPFDGVDTIIHKKLAGDRSMSIEQIMRNAGRDVRIVPKVLVGDRINAARTIFPTCRFDETKCADGVQHLRRYCWPPTSKLGVVGKEPLHNADSHAGEAFTRAGQCLRQPESDVEMVKVPAPYYGEGNYAPFG